MPKQQSECSQHPFFITRARWTLVNAVICMCMTQAAADTFWNMQAQEPALAHAHHGLLLSQRCQVQLGDRHVCQVGPVLQNHLRQGDGIHSAAGGQPAGNSSMPCPVIASTVC